MIRKQCCEFFVASCLADGGVYSCRLYDGGKVDLVDKTPMPSPMFLSMQSNRLWAILRAPFENSDISGVVAYDIDKKERLTKIIPTHGVVACHIATDGEDVYCANYISGSVFKYPDSLVSHSGRGKDVKRQASPHAHFVGFSPDKKHLICCDLGVDTVLVYDRELNFISSARVPDGAGARHGVFSRDGKHFYCINEMDGSISVFSWSAPSLTLLNTVSVLPPNARIVGSGAAIKLSNDGRYIYVTERATGNIVTLAVDGERLTVIAHTNCHGREPRDFTLLANGRFAVCSNQFSDGLSVFRILENGIPQYIHTVEIPAPICAIEKIKG